MDQPVDNDYDACYSVINEPSNSMMVFISKDTLKHIANLADISGDDISGATTRWLIDQDGFSKDDFTTEIEDVVAELPPKVIVTFREQGIVMAKLKGYIY